MTGPLVSPGYAAVAVPAPLPGALTYEIPPELANFVVPGVRVRVPLGRRQETGVVLAVGVEPPAGVTLRPLVAVLDREPVLLPDLLELVTFISTYYRAPVGEVARALLPGDLPPWGDGRVRLTSAGAFAEARDNAEAAVLEALRSGATVTASELQRRLGLPDLGEVLERLAAAGRVAWSAARRSGGARYTTAVELPPGDLAAQLDAAGRSAAGRAVVEYLAALGRPAGLEELTQTAKCTDAVVRRLIRLGVLRSFTQVERLSTASHRLEALEAGPAGPTITLRPDQEAAGVALSAALAAREFTPFLLVGMTGSGKTEVYLRAAAQVLAAGRSVILLVPEIALVPALAREVQARFGELVALWHSALGAPLRHQEWERVRRGEARLVLGPRSALFAPVESLGLIVVDEEQDPAYKQDSAPRYHGRDLALVRARSAGAVALLASATPSLESRWNAEKGKLQRLELTARAGQGSLPEGVLVDLREEGFSRRPGEVSFSARLMEEITTTAAAGGQIILLRNRRGYSPALLCRACGEGHRCEDCGLPRTLHLRSQMLVCHYCGSTLPVPQRCGSCGESALEPMGSGTERVEETFRELFPHIPVDVLDRDAARQPGGLAAVLTRFGRGETQALIGTQMVSKGHHFPNVALTGVLLADSYLGFADFRAVERTYNLLTQVAGRAGRGERPGKVVIQTYHPEHYAIQAAIHHDDARFAAEEMRFRHTFHYPPFNRMVYLLLRGTHRERTAAAANEVASALYTHPRAHQVRIAGPAPAPLERLRGEWRYQLVLRAPRIADLHALLDALPTKLSAELVVDVDPQDLL